MRVDKTIIDGNKKNNMARFINHSCNPNCALEIEDDKGTPHACIFVLKKIKSGSELTFDYKWQCKQEDPFPECLCGSKNAMVKLKS
jgi:histone-lysine N-methyltransferase NSD2